MAHRLIPTVSESMGNVQQIVHLVDSDFPFQRLVPQPDKLRILQPGRRSTLIFADLLIHLRFSALACVPGQENQNLADL